MAKVAESFPVHMSFESNAGGRSEMQSAASADVVVAAVAELFGETSTHPSIYCSSA